MADIHNQVTKLFSEKKYYEIIALLEPLELDFNLALSLVRAYLNASLKTNDPESLCAKAHKILDSFALEGKDDPKWLYLKGMALYQDNLIPDSMMRLERALTHVSVGDHELFNRINACLENCKSLMIQSEFKGLNPDDFKIVSEHIEKYFGKGQRLCSLFGVEVIHIPPSEDHPYNKLISCGLGAKLLNVPNGFDKKLNAHLELCLFLPKDYRFTQDKDKDWPVYLLLQMIRHVIGALNFIGFGYYVKEEPSLAPSTAYDGVMLTALGDYAGECQAVNLSDGSTVRFYQLVPLQPMETRYRMHHTAIELLRLFERERIVLTPFIAARPDVCCGPEAMSV